MKIKYRILIVLLLMACVVMPVSAAGGSGTASDPYQIQTAAELQSIINNLGAYYILMNDIDLSGRTWTPIGTSGAGFHGYFDGNGKIIKNLVLSSTSGSPGFFGYVTSGATITDVTFQDCSVSTVSTSSTPQCGVVIGSIIMSSSAHDSAVISNVDCVRCSARSKINFAGCLVGHISSSSVVEITDCDVSYCYAEATDSGIVGCLVGYIYGSSVVEITRSDVLYSYAHSVHHNDVACMVGACTYSSSLVIDESTVQNSIAEATGNTAGGLVARCGASAQVNALNCNILNCLVKGSSNVGGLYGVNYGSSFAASDCTVTDCTIVATSNNAGGIMGRISSGQLGIFSGCTVSGCTILANTYAAGICPAYS